MRFINLISIFIIYFSSSFTAYAELKIGFVSTERIFAESKPAKKATEILKKEFADREKQLQSLSQEIRDKQNTLEKDAISLNDKQKKQLERDIANMSRDFQRSQRQLREDLNIRRNEELNVVLQIANGVIQEIAKKEGYDLILQEAVYRSDKIDITDMVIKALSK